MQEGKVVAVPTETVYGLAADALNPSAIAKVFEVKNRPADNPLICHFSSMQHVQQFVEKIPVSTKVLMKSFSPGPISFMLDLPQNSPLAFATCGSAQVIGRIPANEIFLGIITQLNRPVAAPSANTSGRVSATSAQMVEEDLKEKISGVVDGGICSVGIESTIVDARDEQNIFILRPGRIGEKEIQRVLPSAKILSGKTFEQTTPGTKYRHYSPATPLFSLDTIEMIDQENEVALLLTQDQYNGITDEQKKNLVSRKLQVIILGSMKNLDELARNFYQHLFQLDHLNLQKAFFLKNDWGNSSLGKALQNRMEKIIQDYVPPAN